MWANRRIGNPKFADVAPCRSPHCSCRAATERLFVAWVVFCITQERTHTSLDQPQHQTASQGRQVSVRTAVAVDRCSLRPTDTALDNSCTAT